MKKLVFGLGLVVCALSCMGQSISKDSLSKDSVIKEHQKKQNRKDSIIKEHQKKQTQIKLIDQKSSWCTDYLIKKNPIWAKDTTTSKTFYKNCKWSGTYVVLNSDSTFIMKHNGEGSADFLSVGKYKITSDTLLVLNSDKELSENYIKEFVQFENTQYKYKEIINWKYAIRKTLLIDLK